METHRRNWILGIVFLVVLISLTCVSWVASVRQRFDEMRPIALTQIAISRATAEAETWLTQEYAEQVSQIIEEFEINQHTLDFVKGRKISWDITTGYFRKTYGNGFFPLEPGSVWMVVTSASVRKVRVLEYTPDRIKAVATVDRVYDNVTIEGEIVEASLSDYMCGIYVFLKEDDRWKLAGFFLTVPPMSGDIYHQWDYLDQEMEDIIGDLPDGDLCPR